MCQACSIKKLLSRRRKTQDSVALRAPQAGIRAEKVCQIRQQLGKGTYNIGDLVDTVVDKIIKDLK